MPVCPASVRSPASTERADDRPKRRVLTGPDIVGAHSRKTTGFSLPGLKSPIRHNHRVKIDVMQSSRSSSAATKVYATAELYEMQRLELNRARAIPPGSERNQHRQIAKSIRRLLGDPTWLVNHADVGEASRACDRCGMQMKHLADLRSSGLHPAERIYRCHHCNYVISEIR
jgi:hypothetical protein